MSQMRIILVPLLLLSIIRIGNCRSAIPCRTASHDDITYSCDGYTASSNTWEYIGTVLNSSPAINAINCLRKCRDICKNEQSGGPSFTPWPGCKAFSSYTQGSGNTCWCYGWNHKPTLYSSSGYLSGWCES